VGLLKASKFPCTSLSRTWFINVLQRRNMLFLQ
jgi:hypothetical protein